MPRNINYIKNTFKALLSHCCITSGTNCLCNSCTAAAEATVAETAHPLETQNEGIVYEEATVRCFVSKEDPMSSLSLVDVETEEVIVRVERRQHASLTHQQSPSLSLCLCLSSSLPLPSLPRSLSLCLCLSSCLPFPSLSRSLSLCSLCLSSSLPHSPEAEARGGGGSGGVISTRNRRKRRMSRKEWSRRRNMRKRKMEE